MGSAVRETPNAFDEKKKGGKAVNKAVFRKKGGKRKYGDVRNLRASFDSFPNVQHINWFPGHMVKAQRQMVEQILRNKHYKFDVLVEVRDARIPFTSGAIFEPESASRLLLNQQQLVEENAAENAELDPETNMNDYEGVEEDGMKSAWDGPKERKRGKGTKQANVLFFEELKKRERHIKRLIVFNKSDLADPQHVAHIRQYYEKQRKDLLQRIRDGDRSDPQKLEVETEVVFTSCQSGPGIGPSSVKKIVETALKMAQRKSVYESDKPRELPSNRFKTIPYVFMIVGIPNVGKSSIINALRQQFRVDQKKKAKEGALPGVTRHISGFMVCEKPRPCMVIDTPGVLMPTIHTSEQAYKLSLSAAVKMLSQKKSVLSSIHEDSLCDYLLFIMNQQRKFKYVEICGLSEPTDDINEVLAALVERQQFFKSSPGSGKAESGVLGSDEGAADLDQMLAARLVNPNTQAAIDKKALQRTDSRNRAASHFVKLFRNGEFGAITLDKILP